MKFPHPKGYVCYQGTPVLSGRMDHPAWANAPWSDVFIDIEGDVKPAPTWETRVKMLWDEEFFYVGAKLTEPNVWATLTAHDSVIFHDNDFEVFIDPDGDNHQYYEYEINALGTDWDLRLVKPYRDGGHALNEWEIPGLRKAVYVQGTINDPSDEDEWWGVELAFPWKVLAEFSKVPLGADLWCGPPGLRRTAPDLWCGPPSLRRTAPDLWCGPPGLRRTAPDLWYGYPGLQPERSLGFAPRPGDQWRVNFSRVEWDVEVSGGKYEKIAGRPEHNWVWSPQHAIDMHRPELWGYVQFSHMPPGTDAFRPDAEWETRCRLMEVYHAQKAFFEKNQRWGTTLTEVGAFDGISFALTSSGWTARLAALAVREDSLIWVISAARPPL